VEKLVYIYEKNVYMFELKRLRPLRCPLFYFQGRHPVVFKWLAVSGGNFRGG
jgi:hypothetical protein